MVIFKIILRFFLNGLTYLGVFPCRSAWPHGGDSRGEDIRDLELAPGEKTFFSFSLTKKKKSSSCS